MSSPGIPHYWGYRPIDTVVAVFVQLSVDDIKQAFDVAGEHIKRLKPRRVYRQIHCRFLRFRNRQTHLAFRSRPHPCHKSLPSSSTTVSRKVSSFKLQSPKSMRSTHQGRLLSSVFTSLNPNPFFP